MARKTGRLTTEFDPLPNGFESICRRGYLVRHVQIGSVEPFPDGGRHEDELEERRLFVDQVGEGFRLAKQDGSNRGAYTKNKSCVHRNDNKQFQHVIRQKSRSWFPLLYLKINFLTGYSFFLCILKCVFLYRESGKFCHSRTETFAGLDRQDLPVRGGEAGVISSSVR